MSESITLQAVTPTVYFTREGNNLRQLIYIELENRGVEAEAAIEMQTEFIRESHILPAVSPGRKRYELLISEIDWKDLNRFKLALTFEGGHTLP